MKYKRSGTRSLEKSAGSLQSWLNWALSDLEKKLIRNELDMYAMQKDKANGELTQLRSRIPQLETKLITGTGCYLRDPGHGL